jgi:predicted transcriptional regulator
MGQSAPTVTDAFETFQARYAAFRAELHPREQRWFDELVCAARRHSNAINRRPHLDFERPVMLAVLMEAMRRMGESEARLQREVQEVQRALLDAGLAVRRLPAPEALGHRGVGQARLHDHEAPRAVPA